ncbi:hypothetical protein FSP39_002947 [Pinctada imbricata]|uniref:Caspase family p20 domain-containing protein n=1 Tax=Pinctada imbricata TaxID=66713 RepID=A0AA88XUR7_PINIB|nr:hypothetical protein FSP39_002947 [Pinctada imbricata]
MLTMIITIAIVNKSSKNEEEGDHDRRNGPKKKAPPSRNKRPTDYIELTGSPELIRQFEVKRDMSVYGSFSRHMLASKEDSIPPTPASDPPRTRQKKPPLGFRLPPAVKAGSLVVRNPGSSRDPVASLLSLSNVSPRHYNPPSIKLDDPYLEDYNVTKALVLIFNQQTFQRNGELLMSLKRQYALQDGAELKKLFDEMEYTTKLHTDLKADDIAHEIYKVVTSDEENGDYPGTYDAFICCIGSHGNSERFLGHDCRPIDVAPMLEALSSEDCVRFATKPKLFFINASRPSFETVKGPITTTAKDHYRNLQNLAIDPVEHASLSFEVKTNLDASVALMVTDDIEEPIIEIIIGASKNRKWIIRTRNIRQEENNIVIEKQIKNYLNEFEYKPFWISWYNADIRVGYGLEAGKNIKLILKDFRSYIQPHKIHTIAIASSNKCHWKFHLPEKPDQDISLPPQHFLVSYSPLGASKKYRTHKTALNSRNAKTGSQYFQTFVNVFRRTHASVPLDEIIHQMNKEISHTFVPGQDGVHRKFDKEPITDHNLGFRNVYFKTKKFLRY